MPLGLTKKYQFGHSFLKNSSGQYSIHSCIIAASDNAAKGLVIIGKIEW